MNSREALCISFLSCGSFGQYLRDSVTDPAALSGTITRYEDDQLFLDDISARQHQENDAIIRKLDKIQPYLKIFTGVTSILTAAIIGIYAWDAIKTFYM